MINCIHNKKADQIYSLGGRYLEQIIKKAVLVSFDILLGSNTLTAEF